MKKEVREMMAVKPVHTRIDGRGRFYIQGLKGSQDFKTALESILYSDGQIKQVSASMLTGRILVRYDENKDLEQLIVTLEDAVRKAVHYKQQLSEADTEKTDKGLKSTAAKAIQKLRSIVQKQTGPGGKEWHICTTGEVLDHFTTDMTVGIPETSVQIRRKEFGTNVLPRTVSRSGLQIFGEQLNSLPVYLLGAAAGVSILTGGVLDAVIIFGVVVANGVIGYVTESKAEKNIDALNGLVHHTAEVIRDGRSIFVPAEEVVSGDVLILTPGAFVPADSRIIQASQLTIDESMLTGESLPVEKSAYPIKDADISLADRKNMAFMGTCITGGQGKAVVVATGENSEIGKLKILLNDTQVPLTPIERQLDSIGNQLIVMCGVVCSGVFGLGLFMGFGVLGMLRMSISLAAAAVPEGLPTLATVNFALGINRMKKHDIIVRHLPAVETLGAIQTICLDKTGTITKNRMKVTSIHAGLKWIDLKGQKLFSQGKLISPADMLELEKLYDACALCCETKINGKSADGRLDISGSATESALTQMVDFADIDVKGKRKASPLLEINHRSEKRLFMSTVHRIQGSENLLVMVKGSPLEVLSRCDYHIRDSEKLSLTDEDRLSILQANTTMATDTLRVLGFACREAGGNERGDLEVQMTWLGLIGMMDPPRDGIKELISQFHRAGVKTVMITGDQKTSARAIADQIGLSQGQPLNIMDAVELNRMDEKELVEKAGKVHVFSRVTPSQKLKIVKAIQAGGQTVAMTGDGINDGPALKASDIGIAMGKTGTDLARDVADVVLSGDNIELMAGALEDGRCIYQNIRKSVHFSLATNISEIQLIAVSIAFGLNSPLNVMQLLWINLISDVFPGLALSAEKPEFDVMEQVPRDPAEPLFSKKDFGNMLFESSVLTGSAMGSLLYGIARYGTGMRAGGLAFQVLTMGQLLHAVSCRSETSGLFTGKKLPKNRYLNWALGGSILLQITTMFFSPLRSLLGLAAVGLADGLVITAGSTLPLIVNELGKALRNKRRALPPRTVKSTKGYKGRQFKQKKGILKKQGMETGFMDLSN